MKIIDEYSLKQFRTTFDKFDWINFLSTLKKTVCTFEFTVVNPAKIHWPTKIE